MRRRATHVPTRLLRAFARECDSQETRPMSPIPKVVQALVLERFGRLSAIRGMALLGIVVFSVAANGAPSESQTRQDVLAETVDTNVSPGDDFYQYATGTWLRQHPIPDEQA